MNFAVSSYIPTIKALGFSREKIRKQKDEIQKQILIVTASDDRLDFEEEVHDIKGIISKHYKTISLTDRSKQEVLDQLRHSSIIHFACHGISNSLDPSSSYLRLGNANEELLTIDDLAKVKHDRAQLAYLSACSTAENSASHLIDEMIHLANAFQQSGYPHVIGTLWEADNECAAIVAKRFYESLLVTAPDNKWHNNIAYALHEAVKTLMQDKWFKEDYLAWAAFIHIGG